MAKALQQRMSTGRLSAFLGNVFAQILRQIVGISEKKLSCKYLMTSREEKEKTSLPVDVNTGITSRYLEITSTTKTDFSQVKRLLRGKFKSD